MNVRALVGLLALAILTSACSGAQGAAPITLAPPIMATGALGEQSHEAGSVKVAASWIEGSLPTLRVTLDTHSVNLDGFDLKQLARLRIDGASWIAPTAWDAPAGGHHRSGALTFGSLDPQALASARVVELELRDVAVPSHLLRWERA